MVCLLKICPLVRYLHGQLLSIFNAGNWLERVLSYFKINLPIQGCQNSIIKSKQFCKNDQINVFEDLGSS